MQANDPKMIETPQISTKEIAQLQAALCISALAS